MMSDMARDFFHGNALLAGPLIAMLLFSLVFLAAIVHVTRAKRGYVDHVAHLPLEGDDEAGEGSEEVHDG